MYYLCSENKGAHQLRGYNRETDLRLCFHICENPVFQNEAHLCLKTINLVVAFVFPVSMTMLYEIQETHKEEDKGAEKGEEENKY